MRKSGVLLAVVVLALGACGDSDNDNDNDGAAAITTSSSAPSASGGGSSGTVSVRNSSFAPPSVTIKTGEKVIWTFADTFAHTATADDDSFDSGPKSNGATFEHTFTKAGTFRYKCEIHPSMTASVTVT